MDLQNADCIIIQGSNMAEAHPVGFRHPMIAREKGAKLIHVDPRFTRTSAMCDIYTPIRAGTDIVFLGGLINYVIENEEVGGEPGAHEGQPRPNDPTLQHPRCVFQILKRHFSRYTPDMVERVTGCPKEAFLKIAESI